MHTRRFTLFAMRDDTNEIRLLRDYKSLSLAMRGANAQSFPEGFEAFAFDMDTNAVYHMVDEPEEVQGEEANRLYGSFLAAYFAKR